MKRSKLILSCLFFMIIMGTGTALAQSTNPDPEKDINIEKKNNPNRSLCLLPEASIFYDILTVSFDDSGVYDLYILNEYGETVFYSTLPANGMPYTYDLSAILNEEGFYTLVIEGSSGTFIGCF